MSKKNEQPPNNFKDKTDSKLLVEAKKIREENARLEKLARELLEKKAAKAFQRKTNKEASDRLTNGAKNPQNPEANAVVTNISGDKADNNKLNPDSQGEEPSPEDLEEIAWMKIDNSPLSKEQLDIFGKNAEKINIIIETLKKKVEGPEEDEKIEPRNGMEEIYNEKPENGIPLTITSKLRHLLRTLRVSGEDISKLTPEEAWKLYEQKLSELGVSKEEIENMDTPKTAAFLEIKMIEKNAKKPETKNDIEKLEVYKAREDYLREYENYHKELKKQSAISKTRASILNLFKKEDKKEVISDDNLSSDKLDASRKAYSEKRTNYVDKIRKTVSEEKFQEESKAFLESETELRRQGEIDNGPTLAKFKTGTSKLIDTWDNFGNKEAVGFKEKSIEFGKRVSKMLISMSFMGLTGAVSVEGAAKIGLGTASALGKGMTSYLGRKLIIGGALGSVMNIEMSKGKKLALQIAMMAGTLALAVAAAGAVSGTVVTSGLIMAGGVAVSQLSQRGFSEDKIKNKFKQVEEKNEIDVNKLEDSVAKFEKEYAEALRRAENTRIYRKVAGVATGIATNIVGLETAGTVIDHKAEATAVDNTHPKINTENTSPSSQTQNENHSNFMSGIRNTWNTISGHNIAPHGNSHPVVTENTNSEHHISSTDNIPKDQEAVSQDLHIKGYLAHDGENPQQGHNNLHTEQKELYKNDSEELRSQQEHEKGIYSNDTHKMTPEEMKHQAEIREHQNHGKFEAERDKLYANDKAELESQKLHEAEMHGNHTTNTNASETNHGQPEIKHELTANQMKDIVVHKGEGIEHTFIRQIEHNHELAKELGYKGDLNDMKALHAFAGHEAHVLAIKEGYVDNAGHEIRINEANKIGYEIKMEHGHATINEVSVDGKAMETHHEGDQFGGNHNKYEYTKETNSHADHFANPKEMQTTNKYNADDYVKPEVIGLNNFGTDVKPEIVNINTQPEIADLHKIPGVIYGDKLEYAHGTEHQTPHYNPRVEHTDTNSAHPSTHHHMTPREVYNLTQENVQKIVDHIFHSDKLMNEWNSQIKDHMTASDLLKMHHDKSYPDDLNSHGLKQLATRMEKIQEITGTKPETHMFGDKSFDESVDQYLRRELLTLEKMGMTDKIKRWL